MMHTTLFSAAYLVPLTGALQVMAGVMIGGLCALWLKHSAEVQSREMLDGAARLSGQLDQLATALAMTDARIVALAARQDEHSRTAQGGSATSYNVAIRMARSGASRQELMTTCGVTQQEADLVLRLHATDSAVRTAA